MVQQQYVIMPSGAEYEWDGEQYVCQHIDVEIEDNSFDYAGTHCNNGQAGTHTQYNAVCNDCGEDISEIYDWSGPDDYDDSDRFDPER